MTQDEQLMSETIGRISAEKEQLKFKVATLEAELSRQRRLALFPMVKDLVEEWFLPLLLIFLAGLLIVYPAYKALVADTTITHCLTKRSCAVSNGVEVCNVALIGVVEWADDIVHGEFPTIDEAVHAAELLKCPLK